MLDDLPLHPGRIKLDTINTGEQINPKGRVSQLNHTVGGSKIANAQSDLTKTKIIQGFHDPLGIARRASQQDIEIPGLSWTTTFPMQGSVARWQPEGSNRLPRVPHK